MEGDPRTSPVGTAEGRPGAPRQSSPLARKRTLEIRLSWGFRAQRAAMLGTRRPRLLRPPSARHWVGRAAAFPRAGGCGVWEAQTSPQSLYAARTQRPEGGAPAQTGADRWARGAPAAAPRARSAPAPTPDPTSRRAAGLARRERTPPPPPPRLGAPALAAPPLSCPGRARHQSKRREVHVERGARSELRSTRRGCPRPPDPRPSDLRRPQESPSSGAASPPSRCPRCPPPAAVTPKSWHQTLATPCSAKPPRRPPGPGRDSRAPAPPPPGSPPAAGDLGGGERRTLTGRSSSALGAPGCPGPGCSRPGCPAAAAARAGPPRRHIRRPRRCWRDKALGGGAAGRGAAGGRAGAGRAAGARSWRGAGGAAGTWRGGESGRPRVLPRRGDAAAELRDAVAHVPPGGDGAGARRENRTRPVTGQRQEGPGYSSSAERSL